MPAYLCTDMEKIARKAGQAFIDQLTYPGIYRGAPLSVTPILVENEHRRTIVISDADSEAARALPVGMDTVVYGRYFTFDIAADTAALTFAEAVLGAAGTTALVCEPSIPQARYEMLVASSTIGFSGVTADPVLHIYRRRIADIEAQWISTRAEDCAPLAPYLADFDHGEALNAALFARATGFAPLVGLCADRGIGALCITAPHEVEAFTGLPDIVARMHGLIAVYIAGSPDILVCASASLDRDGFESDGLPRPLSQVLSGLGAVAAQKNDMGAGLWQVLTTAGIELLEGDAVLRRFQDCRAGDDLGYFILAGNAVIEGMAAARACLAQRNGSEVTERDLSDVCQAAIGQFAARFGFGGRTATYFDVIHSGARTLLPATAANYPVGSDDRTVAFDQGIVVRDSAGCVRAVSDIARTVCAMPELTGIYEGLRAALIDGLIPRIRPGMSGAHVHAIGVDCLRPLEGQLRAAGLLPNGMSVDAYTRDCGHAMQRQTISSVYFMPGNTALMEEYMLGCVEYVWAIGDVLIGVEEGYIVLPEGTYPFTREVAA